MTEWRWPRDGWLAAGLALLLAAPLLAGRTYYLDDAHALALPLFAALREAILEGHPLTWNPAMFAGYHGLGAGQSGTWYPLNWLLLRCLPLLPAFALSYLLHYWLLARGLLGLARALGQDRGGAVVTAAAALGSGVVAGHTMHHNVIVGLAWSPWLVWAAVATGRQAGWRAPLALAAVLALSLLAGHPQYVFLGLLAAACVVPWTRDPQQAWAGLLGRLAVALALGAVLAACQVLPLLSYVGVSDRPQPGGAWQYLTAVSFEPRDLARLLCPDLFGSPLRGTWPAEGFTHWETRAGCGLALLSLALARLTVGRRDRAWWAAVTLLLVGGLLMLGRHNPLYRLLIQLPPFSVFRAPARYVWLLQLGLAVLAGSGYQLLGQRRLPRRAAVAGSGTVVIATALATWAARPALLLKAGGAVLLALLLGVLLSVTVIAAVRLTARRRRVWRRVFMLGAAVELLVGWHTFALTRPQADLRSPPRLADPLLADPRPRLLLDWRQTAPSRELAPGLARLESNTGLIWGLRYFRGGREALPPLPLLGALQELDAAGDDSTRLQFLLDRWSIGWVVTSPELHSPGLRRVLVDSGCLLYENLTARPDLYAVEAQPVDGAWSSKLTDFVRWAPLTPAVATATRWTVRTSCEAPRLVVLAQSAWPGWLTLVDGQPAPLVVAEGLYLAVAVPAGVHQVEFRFDHPADWLGWQLTKIALLGWIAAWWAAGRAARRR
ncbi:MAG: hypothetical protein IT204_06155 [Fimbriimonadaceae bacterium]|nr:hypothetical protein [Fimbriimonadaceae bacterium]